MFGFFKEKKVSQEEEQIVEVEDFKNIDPLAKYIKESIGIDFDNQKAILKSRVTSLCRTHGIYSFEKCLYEFQNNIAFKEDAINYLTTNESFFYREFVQIQNLVKKVSESLSPVSILCAPCATGEEPYSIVLALLEAGVSKDKFSVTGIDISSGAIKKAQEGMYDKNTVRNLSPEILDKYFTMDYNHFKIEEVIKRKVTFACVNIFEDSFARLGKFDYIFSRNMLIYFDKETKMRAQEVFIKQLKNKDEPIFFGHADFPH